MLLGARQTFFAGSSAKGYRFLAFKFLANRVCLEATSLAALNSQTPRQQLLQLSEIEMLNRRGDVFQMPSGAMVRAYAAFRGRKLVSHPDYTVGCLAQGNEQFGHLFDGKTGTKFCKCLPELDNLDIHERPAFYDMGDASFGTPLLAFGDSSRPVTGMTYSDIGYASLDAMRIAVLGTDRSSPCAAVIDLGAAGAALDISEFDRWRFYNAGDNASQPGRTWVWGEVLGSANGRTWQLLDSFRDGGITNGNFALAYEGELRVRGKGDLFSGLDLAERFG